jgi:hypothetical protein
MVFKVIVKHPSVDDDENTYYGIVFPNRDIGQIKRLKFAPPDTLEATFSFAESKVKPGENFLAILVPVNESEITGSTCGEIACKMGTNSKAKKPEVVEFGY